MANTDVPIKVKKGELIHIVSHPDWGKIAMVPIAKVIPGSKKKTDLKPHRIWQGQKPVVAKGEGVWISAFPKYPDSEADGYPTLEIETRKNNVTETVIAEIDLSLQDTVLQPVPALGGFQFSFPKGDGFDLENLVKFCSPQHLVNTEYSGEGYCESEPGAVEDVEGGEVKGPSPVIVEDVSDLSTEVSALKRKLDASEKVSEEYFAEVRRGELGRAMLVQHTETVEAENESLLGRMMTTENEMKAEMSSRDVLSSKAEKADEMAAAAMKEANEANDARNEAKEAKEQAELAAERLSAALQRAETADRLREAKANAELADRQKKMNILQQSYLEFEERTRSEFENENQSRDNQKQEIDERTAALKLADEITETQVEEMQSLLGAVEYRKEEALSAEMSERAAVEEISRLNSMIRKGKDRYDEELRAAGGERDRLVSELGVALDRERGIEAQLSDIQAQAQENLSGKDQTVNELRSVFESELGEARRELGDTLELEKDLRLKEADALKGVNGELAVAQSEKESAEAQATDQLSKLREDHAKAILVADASTSESVARVAELSREIEGLKAKISLQGAGETERLAKFQEVANDSLSYKQRGDDLQGELDSVRSELAKSNEKIVGLESELSAEREKLIQTTKELKKAQSEFGTSSDLQAAKLEEFAKLNYEHGKARDQLKSMETELSNAKSRAEAAAVQYADSQRMLQKTQEQVTDAGETAALQVFKNQQLVDSLKLAQADLSKMQGEKTLRDREIDDLNANIADLVEKRRVKLEEFNADKASLLSSHEEEIAKYKSEIAKFQEDAAAGPATGAGSPPVIVESVAKELEKLKADLASKVTEIENSKMDKSLVDGLLKHSYDRNASLSSEMSEFKINYGHLEQQNVFLKGEFQRGYEKGLAEQDFGEEGGEELPEGHNQQQWTPEEIAAWEQWNEGVDQEKGGKSGKGKGPETFPLSETGSPDHNLAGKNDSKGSLSPVKHDPPYASDPAAAGAANSGGSGKVPSGSPGKGPGDGSGNDRENEVARSLTAALDSLKDIAQGMRQGGGGPPGGDPNYTAGAVYGAGKMQLGVSELKPTSFEGFPKLNLPEKKSRPKLHPKPGEPKTEMRRDPCMTQWQKHLWLVKGRSSVTRSFPEFGGGWFDEATRLAEEASNRAYMRRKQALNLKLALEVHDSNLGSSLKAVSTSLSSSVAEEKNEGPKGYITGDLRNDEAYRRLDKMCVSYLFISLPVEVQNKIRGMYGDDYTFLEVLYVVGLSTWQNTEEERFDAKVEVTTGLAQSEGETYVELTDRFIFYIKFIVDNTSIVFPVRLSTQAFNTVFEKRTAILPMSLKSKYDFIRMNHNIDEWSEEKDNSGTPSTLIEWAKVVIEFIKQDLQPDDVKAKDTNYDKPIAALSGGGHYGDGGGGPGGAGGRQPGPTGQPKDYSDIWCYRCLKLGHPHWKCTETIGGVIGQGAGGPAWTPPPGAKGFGKGGNKGGILTPGQGTFTPGGKQPGGKADGGKGFQGTPKGGQPKGGQPGSGTPVNQLRWRARDKFLATLPDERKEAYLEQLKSVVCQQCGEKGHGARDCLKNPPTKEQIDAAFANVTPVQQQPWSAPIVYPVKGGDVKGGHHAGNQSQGIQQQPNWQHPPPGGHMPPAAEGERKVSRAAKRAAKVAAQREAELAEVFKAGLRAAASQGRLPVEESQAVDQAKADAQARVGATGQTAAASAKAPAPLKPSAAMSFYDEIIKNWGENGTRVGSAAISPRLDIPQLIALFTKFMKKEDDVRNKGPSIADSGATDGYYWVPRGVVIGEDEVNITNGLRTILEIFDSRELKVNGPQLTPVGKCCRYNCADYIHLGGKEAPIMTDLDREDKERLAAMYEKYTPLETHNDIPILTEKQTELYRDRLQEARGLLSPEDFRKQKKDSHAASVSAGIPSANAGRLGLMAPRVIKGGGSSGGSGGPSSGTGSSIKSQAAKARAERDREEISRLGREAAEYWKNPPADMRGSPYDRNEMKEKKGGEWFGQHKVTYSGQPNSEVLSGTVSAEQYLVTQFEQLDIYKRFDQMMILLRDPLTSETLKKHIGLTNFGGELNLRHHPEFQSWLAESRTVVSQEVPDQAPASLQLVDDDPETDPEMPEGVPIESDSDSESGNDVATDLVLERVIRLQPDQGGSNNVVESPWAERVSTQVETDPIAADDDLIADFSLFFDPDEWAIDGGAKGGLLTDSEGASESPGTSRKRKARKAKGGIAWGSSQHVMTDALPQPRAGGNRGNARGIAGQIGGTLARWGMLLACLAGFVESSVDADTYAKAMSAFATSGKPKIYDLRYLPTEIANTVDRLDTLGWTHLMIQREQVFESVPWSYEIYPFGRQLHGGWSNRRLTVIYKLEKEGTWVIANKKYDREFSREKIITNRYPYLVVTLFRRREIEGGLADVPQSGFVPEASRACEYYDLPSSDQQGGHPAEDVLNTSLEENYERDFCLNTTVEEVYGDIVFMSRSTEEFWNHVNGPNASDPVPSQEGSARTYGFIGEHDAEIKEEDLIGRWKDSEGNRVSTGNALPEGFHVLDEATNEVSKVLHKELSQWVVCLEKGCHREGEPFVVWEAIDVEEDFASTRKQKKRERGAAFSGGSNSRPPNVLMKRIHDRAVPLVRGTEGSAGFDLSITQNVTIPPKGKALLPTGWEMAIPDGWYGKIHARSGVSHQKHTEVVAGVIDSDYRGEVRVLMFNHSNKPVVFCTGDRVAQMTFQEVNVPEVIEVSKLGETDRGKKGFGSTDVKPEQCPVGGPGEQQGVDDMRTATPGVKDSTSQTVKPERAKPDPQKYRLKQRPCDYIRTTHTDGFHPNDGNASTCVSCSKSNLRAKNRSSTGRQEHRIRINIGGFSVDLMSRLTDLSIWQTSMVLTSHKLGKGSRPIHVALKMKSKTAKEIKVTLLRCLAIAEHIWLSQPISRLHSDQEPGLVNEPSWLFRAGITLTMTEGYSSKDNPAGENGVQNVAKMARVSMAPMSDLPETFKSFLFPYAVEFSAAYLSAFNAELDERDSRLKRRDLAPFGSKVLYKLGPSLKLNSDEDQASFGWYLGPNLFVKHGSFILTNSAPHKVVTATTVKLVTSDDTPIFPKKEDNLTVPVEQRGRPRKAEREKVRKEKSERGPGRPRKDGQPPVKGGVRSLHSKIAFPALMGDDFSVEVAGIGRGDGEQCTFDYTKANFSEDVTPSILCEREWDLDACRSSPRMLYTTKGDWESCRAGKPRVTAPGDGRPKVFGKSIREEVTTEKNGEQTLHVYFTEGTLQSTVESLNSQAFSSFLPEGGYTEDQLRDLQEKDSEGSSRGVEIDMDWDIIDKDGNNLPPLDDFFPDLSVSALGQKDSDTKVRSRQYRDWYQGGNRKRANYSSCENHPLIELAEKHAHVTRVIPISEAKKRPGYKDAMQKEMSRFLEYSAYGKPIPWSKLPARARIYRGKPIYGVKFWEQPADQHKDKARVVVQGCLQIKKHGGVVLDKLTRKRGEYWCPVGSMADLRLVLSCCAIQELSHETSDLSNGYLQTPTETPSLFIDLAQELKDILPDEWQKLIKEAIEEDIRLGGSGRCAFPALKNLYGESFAGTSFVYQYQRAFELAGWKRCRTSPALFYKRCDVTGRLQLLVSYVDDIAAALSNLDSDPLWENLKRQGWIFSEVGELKRFVGIHIHKINSRQFHLEQKEYLEQVVAKFEERHKDQYPNGIKGRRTLPMHVPVPNEQPCEYEGARTDIGGLAYAGRGMRADLCRAVNALAACANRWTEAASEFRDAIMAYVRGTPDYRLNIDARGMPKHLEAFNVCAWGDGDYHAPKCHAGALIALRPHSQAQLAGDITRTLPWDWSSSTNRYSKLNTTESELVALGLVSRAAIEHSTTWVELLTGGTDYLLNIGYERLDGGDLEPYETVYVYEDNIPCRLACERGWSSKLISMPRTYGVSLCWISERIQQGLLKLVDERTTHMVADVFTKMVKPTVLFDARIMIEFREREDLGGEGAAIANLSARMVNAAVNSSEPVRVDYRKRPDGDVEVKLLLPKALFEDSILLEKLLEGFGIPDSHISHASGPTGKVATE